MRLIILHSASANAVLNKKIITKKLLFSYLSDLNIPIQNSAGKPDLIEKILNIWKNNCSSNEPIHVDDQNSRIQEPNLVQTVKPLPIQEMSEEFVGWFFNKLNRLELLPNDLWNDSTCSLRMIDCYNSINDSYYEGYEGVLNAFMNLRQQFNFIFNPNVCSLGVQGKMNRFGMVMVACCGTVHHSETCVGVFECSFGLFRDHNETDSWKMQHTKMQIKSVERDTRPVLDECETLAEILMMPIIEEVS